MKWIYLYQDRNDLCKYITSEKPDEWQGMMYYDFLSFLSHLNINDRNDFMFYFSFIGKILFIDLETGQWHEEKIEDTSTFSELLALNQKEENEDFSVSSLIKENYTKFKGYFFDKNNRLKF